MLDIKPHSPVQQGQKSPAPPDAAQYLDLGLNPTQRQESAAIVSTTPHVPAAQRLTSRAFPLFWEWPFWPALYTSLNLAFSSCSWQSSGTEIR
jgi:hypothetical protein